MRRTVLAIIAIFLCTTAGWVILGSTIFARTMSAGSSLSERVATSWGSPQKQAPPVAAALKKVERQVHQTREGVTTIGSVEETVSTPLSLEQSRIRAMLSLDHRKKGLLWFATYRVDFSGAYVFRNSSDSDEVAIRLELPVPGAIYDGMIFLIDGERVPLAIEGGSVTASVRKAPGSVIRVETGYRSQGLGTWSYSFGSGASQVEDFRLVMTTDFEDIDFPEGTLSPTGKNRVREGWLLEWRYASLVSGSEIGMVMPEKLQPGPIAGRISFFAPVSLLFFFFLIFIITTLREIDLHPMHYFFLAASFFAFHLLLGYLADHISIHLAFILSSAVSVFLVVSYMRIVVGPRFAFREVALAQVVYLVLFSYAFFFKGFTGLSIAIGSVVTLFVVMRMTARIDWRARERTPVQGSA